MRSVVYWCYQVFFMCMFVYIIFLFLIAIVSFHLHFLLTNRILEEIKSLLILGIS